MIIMCDKIPLRKNSKASYIRQNPVNRNAERLNFLFMNIFIIIFYLCSLKYMGYIDIVYNLIK